MCMVSIQRNDAPMYESSRAYTGFCRVGESMRDIAADGMWVLNTFHSKEGSRGDTLKTALIYVLRKLTWYYWYKLKLT